MALGARSAMSMRLLVFAPTRRAPTETFVRANLQGLPFEIIAYFGDEQPLSDPGRLAYGLAILVSKALTRFGFLRLASLPGSGAEPSSHLPLPSQPCIGGAVLS